MTAYTLSEHFVDRRPITSDEDAVSVSVAGVYLCTRAPRSVSVVAELMTHPARPTVLIVRTVPDDVVLAVTQVD